MDYTMVIVWVIVIAVAVVVELETFSLVSAWFVGGGLIALILSMIDAWTGINIGWHWQVIVFVAVSVVSFLGFRPLAKKYLKNPTVPTNADANLGKRFKLLSDVKGGRSSVSINDVVWTVQISDELKAGDFVILKDISGNKYIAESPSADSHKNSDNITPKKKEEVKSK